MSTEVRTQIAGDRTLGIIRRNWIELIAFTLFVIYWLPAFANFWKAWGNPDEYYSHGYLIPFMCGWTAWLKKDIAARMKPSPSTWAFVLLIGTLMFATMAGLQNSQTMRGLAFPISLAWFVAVLYGWNFVKEFAFPIFYLYFLCPIPEFILLKVAFTVQIWSTIIATLISKLFLISATRVGTAIQTDNVSVEVGAPCSGFRMLVALTAFAIFLVYAVKGEAWRKILFVIIAMPLSVLINSLRVALLVLVGHYWDPNLVPVVHDYSGYTVLVVAFILMYALARMLGCREFRLME